MDYERLMDIRTYNRLTVCFCFKCSICRMYADPHAETRLNPHHNQFLDYAIAATGAFPTRGQVDGVYAEARALYNEKGQDMERMEWERERCTVDCTFDVWTAFQLCINFDGVLWLQYPHIFQLSPENGLHMFLTMDWPRQLRLWRPELKSTAT